MKFCKGCNQSKALTEFYKQSGHRDGLQYKCKVCKKAQIKKWRQNNPEKVNASRRKYGHCEVKKTAKGTRYHAKINVNNVSYSKTFDDRDAAEHWATESPARKKKSPARKRGNTSGRCSQIH